MPSPSQSMNLKTKLTDIPGESSVQNQDSARQDDQNDCDLYTWTTDVVLRIESLSKQELRSELEDIFEERTYSWHSINTLLQTQLERGALAFTLIGGDVVFEWNNLCEEKRSWERQGELSNESIDFLRDCLINFMILPFLGGIGREGLELVTKNVDKSDLSSRDLWVAHERREVHMLVDEDERSTDSGRLEESLSWIEDDGDWNNDLRVLLEDTSEEFSNEEESIKSLGTSSEYSEEELEFGGEDFELFSDSEESEEL